MLSALKSQKQLAQQSANEAKRVAARLQQERAVDEDMYMIMCDNMREKDLEVSPLFVFFSPIHDGDHLSEHSLMTALSNEGRAAPSRA